VNNIYIFGGFMEEKNIGASNYLYLGLYAFAGFGLEILLSMLLPSIFGVESSEYTIMQECIYWLLTCALWGAVSIILINLSKKKYAFDIMKNNEAPSGKQWLIAVVIATIAIVITTIVGDGLKPVQEYINNGIIKFIFQHIYYLFETALIVLAITFGQKFGETITKRTGMPYGGLFLAFTWGLIHILTQGLMTGVYTFAMAILYGTVYILLKKNIRCSYLLIAVMFIL